jgi:hypothetical protein
MTDFVSEGLSYELAQHNVDVISWRAGGILKKSREGQEPEFGLVDPKEFAA